MKLLNLSFNVLGYLPPLAFAANLRLRWLHLLLGKWPEVDIFFFVFENGSLMTTSNKHTIYSIDMYTYTHIYIYIQYTYIYIFILYIYLHTSLYICHDYRDFCFVKPHFQISEKSAPSPSDHHHQALGWAPEVAAGLLPELDRLAGPPGRSAGFGSFFFTDSMWAKWGALVDPTWKSTKDVFCDVLDTKKQREGQGCSPGDKSIRK